MASVNEDRLKAASLPEGDVIRILLEQHARIQELFADVKTAAGVHKQQAFDELRALLAAHETAEEMVLRPVSRKTSGEATAEARNSEEAEANKVLARLEKMDAGSTEFDVLLGEFESSVLEHAEQEENAEFPAVLTGCDEQRRQRMGTALKAAERIAPTHPHPSTAGSTAAQWAVGPFVSLVDRARDAVRSVGSTD